jgi:2-hydroxychromene-2-carboxylate isomerase
MPNPIEFFLDFSSPYGYFASTRISGLAAKHGRTVVWRPILLGAVFKVTGGAPLPSLPLKGDYSVRDMTRSARYHDIPYKMPSVFPIPTQAPGRIVYWVEGTTPDKVEAAVLALYRAYFVDDQDISKPETAAAAVAKADLDPAQALAATNDPSIKERLKNETQAAIERGVFGSPYVVVDGEPFWGMDRFDQVERWLARGGF